MAQQAKNPTSISEDAVQSLVSVSKGCSIAVSYGVGPRHGLDLAWLWLWCRLVAVV